MSSRSRSGRLRRRRRAARCRGRARVDRVRRAERATGTVVGRRQGADRRPRPRGCAPGRGRRPRRDGRAARPGARPRAAARARRCAGRACGSPRRARATERARARRRRPAEPFGGASRAARRPPGRPRRPSLELAVDVAAGDSGAPVVDRDGRVVGVVYARSTPPRPAYAVRRLAGAVDLTDRRARRDRRTTPRQVRGRRTDRDRSSVCVIRAQSTVRVGASEGVPD